jgi:hypothetical protein
MNCDCCFLLCLIGIAITHNGLDMNLIKDFKKAYATYGLASPFCREYLAG